MVELDVSDASGVRIRVEAADPGEFAPGLSVWAIGADGAFDGGTTAFGGETSTAAFGTPHSFNAVGALGDAGTLWMQTGQGGNAKELVGYAISGPSYTEATGWGESIENGAHDTRLGDTYVTSVSGTTGTGFVELILTGVPAGWFLLYVGGTDPALVGGAHALSVTSVPEPDAALLTLASIVVLAGLGRARAR